MNHEHWVGHIELGIRVEIKSRWTVAIRLTQIQARLDLNDIKIQYLGLYCKFAKQTIPILQIT